jgi:class 3 adenylate cyclase
MAVLREHHAELGRLIHAHEGTLERFAGDGMMVFFNDPRPLPDPAERAGRMALAMRERARALTERWRQSGPRPRLRRRHRPGLRDHRRHRVRGPLGLRAIGTVTNVAARLRSPAGPGQILVSRRVLGAVEALVEAEPGGGLSLKGA